MPGNKTEKKNSLILRLEEE